MVYPLTCSSQTEGEHIKKTKGKKALSSEEVVKESTGSDSDDDETYLSGSMVESSRIKKKIEEEAKAEVAKRKSGVRKEELIDLLGPEVVNKKGPITLKVYREDITSEIIPNFKASTRMDYIYTTEVELGIKLDIPLSKQDPLDKLNDLANKKRKHADDIHDYFKVNKRLKQDLVTIEDFRDFSNTMLYTVKEIFFRLHQGTGLDDHARTFNSLLLVEIDKRNLNPLKQIRVIEQLRK
ncbi:hypothetical protein Tco_1070640 [Tanacetum coccineum]|uniref:Uncharacterized protein n=1 Tax=Tanacetum coccineum TaxID=301880 RepID=A0ABQ5HM07_9ASTR